MADKKGVSYRINLDRTKTTKWTQAQPVDYGGDDWGEEEEYDDYEQELAHTSQRPPVPGFNQQQPAWAPSPITSAQRSFTNPASTAHGRNLSFDRDDDRRLFPAGAPATAEPQLRSQQIPRPGSSSSQQDLQPASTNVRSQAPLQVDTRLSNMIPQSPRADSRDNQIATTHGVPMSAPVELPVRTFDSSHRPALSDLMAASTEARSSKTSTPVHPLRKSSLSSQQSPIASKLNNQPGVSSVRPAQETDSVVETPRFVRPADIYKRMEEEREKERRSQESSRPSLDSVTGVPREDPRSSHDIASSIVHKQTDKESIPQTQRTSKLNTVMENDTRPIATTAQSQEAMQPADDPAVPAQPASVVNSFHEPSSSEASSRQPSPPLMLPDIPFVSPFPTPSISQPTPPLSILPRGTFNSRAEPVPDELPQFQRGVAAPKSQFNSRNNISAFPGFTSSDNNQTPSEELQQKASGGFTSTAQRAFDEESSNNLSRSTRDVTISRSNSTSTSGVSSTIHRKPDDYDYFRIPGQREQAFPEEATTPQERPGSSTTIKPDYEQKSLEALEPSSVAKEIRHTDRAVSPDDSSAYRPIGATTPHVPRVEQATLSCAVEPETKNPDTLPKLVTTSNAPPIPPPHTDHLSKQSTKVISSVSPERTSSDDWQEWQAQRRSFHTQHRLDDGGNPSPTMSSPISRSETPAKGTVREIAGKLEENSGRSTPVSTVGAESTLTGVPRPVAQTRLESFRPSLPGGWQSDTITPSLGNIGTQDYNSPPPQPIFTSKDNRTTSTDSIPTATAPKNWPQSQEDGPLDRALAAASNAMAGAFSGTAFSRKTPQYSDSDSEDEAYPGQTTAQQPSITSRDFATEPTRSSAPIAATSIETPLMASPSSTRDAEHLSSEGQTPVDFPAPLRTSRTNENNTISSRVSTYNPSTATANEDADQLQKDIVQSLTPKTSNIEDPTAKMAGHFPDTEHAKPAMARGASETSYDDVLPQEYNSYWMEKSPITGLVSQQPDSTSENVASRNISSISAPTVQNLTKPHVPLVPTTTSHEVASASTVLPVPALVNQDIDRPHRPMLEQRFSWETPDHKHSTLNVRQAIATARPSTPPKIAVSSAPGAGVSTNPVQSHVLESSALDTSTTNVTQSSEATNDFYARNSPTTPSLLNSADFSAAAANDTMSSFPKEAVTFRNILGYNDPHRRIRAFDDNKQLYAEPNGLLDTWLSSLNVPEHADVFITSRQPRVVPTTNQADNQTTPRREATSGAGVKPLQENTRQLLAVAGKYSGKAGFVAKGLLTKGKEKLRTVSAGDKVSLKSRRMSANDAISPPITPISQHSTFPSTAPQLPAPKLETPVEEVSWSLISSTIDQMFTDPPYQHNRDSATGQRLSQLGIRGELTKDANKRYSTSFLDDRQSLVRAGGVQDSSLSNDVTNPKSTRITSSPLLGRPALQQTQLGGNATSTESSAIVTSNADTTALDLSMSSQSNTKDKLIRLSRTRSSTRRRRPSSISDISEVSHSPGAEELINVVTRTVSPPPEELANNRSQEVPFFLSHDESKEAEARREREEVIAPAGHGSLPPYSGPTDRTSQPRIPPGTQIMPVTDLKGVRGGDRRASGRPFSFMGTETLSSVPSYRPGSSPPPITPVEASQRQSQVGAKRREPEIMDHPAHRRAQEEDVANQKPLPSSQRPVGQPDMVRQNAVQQDTNKAPVEQYRIPGPYVQEYRPPKPKLVNEDFYDPYGRSMRNANTVGTAKFPTETTSRANTPMDMKSVSQVTTDANLSADSRPGESDRTRNKSFGGLFRSRSSSRSREEREDQARNINNLSEENKKQRKILFRFNSSNSALGPQLGNLPEEGIHQAQVYNEGGHRRTLSSDLLRTKPFGSKTQTDTKKKRSSALANLFFRSNNKDRSRSTTSLSQRSDISGPIQQPSMQSLRTYAASPGNNQDITSERTSPNIQSTIRQDPYGGQNSVSSVTEFREYSRRTTSMDETENNFNRNERPDRLRINTGNNTRVANESFTASTITPYAATPTGPYYSNSTLANSYSTSPPVPVTRANRDISYGQDRPYVPPILPPAQAKPPPNIADHVKDLHKRSRSPRLGRPPSEDGLRRADENAVHALDVPNPANRLGTFSNKKASPVGTQRPEEDQEKPWTLTLPSDANNDEDDDNAYVMVNHEQSSVGNGNRQEGNLRQQKTLESVPEGGSSPVGSHQSVRTQENDLTHRRQSREMKRVLLERTPSPFLTTSESRESRPARPQTVAERFMEAQAPVRSTTPAMSPPIHQGRFTGEGETPAPTISRDNTTTTARSTHSFTNNNSGRASTILNPIHNDTSSLREGAGSRAFSRQSDHRSPTPLSQRPVSPIPVSSTQEPQSLGYRSYMNQNNSQPSKNFAPVELPGSRPEGYESEEEPVMSATAYPGQEWMPLYGDDGKWDD